jgi:Uma2 family endonuclease
MSTVLPIAELVLGPEHNGIRLSPAEFDAITEFDELYRYELIDGVLVVNPVASREERSPNEVLGHWLLSYREHHPQGLSLDDTLFEEYVRTTRGRRLVDRLIWAGLGRQPDPDVDIPTLAVEFVSPGRRSWRRDYEEKRDEYLAAGVQEYCVIDRFRRTLTVFKKTGEGFDASVVAEHETYRPELLPGFELPLGQLLAIADRWRRR